MLIEKLPFNEADDTFKTMNNIVKGNYYEKK